jgi:hypothetical protein
VKAYIVRPNNTTVNAKSSKNGFAIAVCFPVSGKSMKKYECIPIKLSIIKNDAAIKNDPRNTIIGMAARFSGLLRGNQPS